MYVEIILLFGIAFLYASVGHGGASGYLALLALLEYSPSILKPTALVINLFVSFIAFIQFYRLGYFSFRLFLPFALFSVPMAYLGAIFVLSDHFYRQFLGIFLLISAIKLLTTIPAKEPVQTPQLWQSTLSGGIIGLLSGMIGIGGGVLLTPLLVLKNWASAKNAAGISALFIFVNSLAGIAGVFQKKTSFPPSFEWWIMATVWGGILGAWLGSRYFNPIIIRRLLALVMFIAAGKLCLI